MSSSLGDLFVHFTLIKNHREKYLEFGSIVSLAAYFALMIYIGVYSYRKSSKDISGYMLGGRSLSPSVTALSAGASDMSGWMLMGLPGAMFVSGGSSIWIAIGLTVGAFLNYIIVAPRLRTYTELANDSITLPDYFENRFQDKTHVLRVVASLVIVVFFTVYTSSGVVAGGKLFESAFGLSYDLGLYITAGVVVGYTLFGGFLAVSLTDFVQGCIMFLALILVPVVVVMEVGGINELHHSVQSIDPNLLDLFHNVSLISIISALAWGLGYFGQPHIIVRFMAIRSVNNIPLARNIGMSWMVVSIIGAMATGFAGIAYAAAVDLNIKDPETIFIVLSQLLFNPLISGFLLAAILAAIMSTISSQLLVTSSSLTNDFYLMFCNKQATDQHLVFVGRVSVFLVALLAIFLAQDPNSSILNIVSNAWAGFGAAFGPVVILSLYWKGMSKDGALAGIITGATTVLLWIYLPVTVNGESLSSTVYEIVPGFIVCTLTILIVSKFTYKASNEIEDVFDKVKGLHH